MFSTPLKRRARTTVVAVVSVCAFASMVPAAAEEPDRPGWVAGAARGQADAAALPAERSDAPPGAEPEVPDGDFTSSPLHPQGSDEALDNLAPEPVRELVDERTALSETWENADGLSRTTVMYAEPRFFETAKGWERIDSRVVPVRGRPGVLANAANDWRVEFAPLHEGGVTVHPESGPAVSTTPAHRPRVAPERDPDDPSVVRYRDVWEGVDLVYTVQPTGVKEDLVLRERPESARFDFEMHGDALREAAPAGRDAAVAEGPPEAPAAVEAAGSDLTLAPVTVTEPDGTPIDEAAGQIQLEDAGDTTRAAVSVDEAWLEGLDAEDYPVIVDPTTILSPAAYVSYRTNGTTSAAIGVGQVNLGLTVDAYRALVYFDYTALLGQQVVSANLTVSRTGGSSLTFPVTAWHAAAANYNGADPAGPCGGICGQATLGTGSANINVTAMYKHYIETSQGLQSLFLTSQENPLVQSLKWLGASLTIVTNQPPPATTPVSPADGATSLTLTPTLAVNPVVDPDGNPVSYWFSVWDGPTPWNGSVWNSGWQSSTSVTLPPGVLTNGRSYRWMAFTFDGLAATTPAWTRALTIDQKLGFAGDQAMQPVGPVAANLATGNLTLGVSGPSLAAVGGNVGVSFAYNSQDTGVQGLRGEYFWDADGQRDFDEPVGMSRIDPQVSFDWGTGPGAPGLASDDAMARWTGFVTVPAVGSYQFGARHDDGVRITVGGTVVLNRWCDCPATGGYEYGSAKAFTSTTLRQEIVVEFYEASGSALIELGVKGAVPEGPVPASWLSHDLRPLPPGWTMNEAMASAARFQRAEVGSNSVTLRGFDGEVLEFTANAATATTGVYVAPAGELGHLEREGILTPSNPADDRIRYTDEGGRTYRFKATGEIDTVTDPVSVDDPAALQYSYDGDGRLLSITDPVASRATTFVYAGVPATGTCPASPSGFDSPAATGLLCEVRYWNNTQTRLWYVAGQLARIAGPGDSTVGHDTWNFTYTSGRLAKIRDPLASDAVAAGIRVDNDTTRWLIAYDGSGRVTTVTAPEPLAGAARPAQTIGYGTGTATVQVAGTTATPERTLALDSEGRVLSESDAAGLTTTLQWDSEGRLVAVTDPAARRTTSIYNAEGYLTDHWGPAPAAWFNASGVPSSILHELNTPRVQTSYDDGHAGLAATWWNNPAQTGKPSGQRTGLAENPDGSVNHNWGTGVPSGSGVTNANSFSGRLSGRITFPSAGTYTLGLGRNGPVRVFLDDDLVIDQWNESAADAVSIPITVTAGQSRRIEIEVADTGTTSPLDQFRLVLTWHHTSTGWQLVPGTRLKPDYGLPTRTIDPDGKRADTVYAEPHRGLPTQTVADPTGLALTTSVTYEAPGTGYSRPLTRTLPAGAATASSRTYYGPTATVDNPCTPTVESINQAGLPRLETGADPDGAGSQVPIVRENRYDVAGRVVASRVGTEPWTCAHYDTRGRVTSVAYPAYASALARTVTYSYASGAPANPLIQTVSDPKGTITTTVDLLGRTVATTDVFAKTMTIAYDQAGRTTTETGPFGTITRTYDAASRLDLTRLDGVTVADVNYNASGEVASVAYPGPGGNGTSLSAIGRNQTGATTSLTWSLNGSTVTDAVTRALSGRVIDQSIDGVDPHPAGANFTYDGAGRLTQARVPGHHYVYGFAASGGCGTLTTAGRNTNRTSLTDNGVARSYCYDNADRLTSTTQPGYTGTIVYDSHGNTTGIAGEIRWYDAADRRWAVTNATDYVLYGHDALDRLISRDDGTTVIKYSMGATLNAANAVIERTITLPGGVLLTKRAGGDVWSYPNIHGDVIATANATGAKQGPTLHWGPYGETLTAVPDNSAQAMDYGWLGQYQRPLEHRTGFAPTYEMGARLYDPVVGRFLEVDPIRGGSCNNYEYACGDPINKYDLTGKALDLGLLGTLLSGVSRMLAGGISIPVGTWPWGSNWHTVHTYYSSPTSWRAFCGMACYAVPGPGMDFEMRFRWAYRVQMRPYTCSDGRPCAYWRTQRRLQYQVRYVTGVCPFCATTPETSWQYITGDDWRTV